MVRIVVSCASFSRLRNSLGETNLLRFIKQSIIYLQPRSRRVGNAFRISPAFTESAAADSFAEQRGKQCRTNAMTRSGEDIRTIYLSRFDWMFLRGTSARCFAPQPEMHISYVDVFGWNGSYCMHNGASPAYITNKQIQIDEDSCSNNFLAFNYYFSGRNSVVGPALACVSSAVLASK